MTAVYVASPYGFSAATRLFYDDVLLPALRAAGHEPLDPWADPDGEVARSFAAADALPEAQRLAALARINASLGAANAEAIRRAGAVLAILDGPDVDSGTAAEIGYAAALGRPVVGLRLDTRRTGDNDAAAVNLQVEHFIRSSGGRIAPTLEEAVAAIGQVA